MSDESKASPEDPAERPRWTRLHLWQIQPIRDLLVISGLFLLLMVGERASVVTVPMVAAVMLAYLVEPLMLRVTRARWLGRKSAASLVLLFGLVFFVLPLVIGVGYAVVQGAQLTDRLASGAGAVIDSVENPSDESLREAIGPGAWLEIRDFLVRVGDAKEPLGAAPVEEGRMAELEADLFGVDDRALARALNSALTWLRENIQRLGKQALSSATGLLSSAVSTLGSIGSLVFGLFLTGFFFFFASTRWDRVTAGAQALLPVKNRERAVHIAGEMDRAVSGFIRGRMVVALILGVFYTLAFALIGVPAPLLIGPLIAFLAIFPYAAMLGLPLVIALLWLERGEGVQGEFWWAVFMPIVVYQVGQALDDYVLTPRIQGDATGLDTPTILAASIAGGALLGLFGLLVAIPLAACVRILFVELLVPRYREWTKGERRDFLPLDEG